jgi:ATP-dependent Clp protease ATP-binding subunit ClpB
MTSNIASEHIMQLTEEKGADWEIEAHVKDILKKYFKPEFLNRIDESIVFHMLTKQDLEKIVDIQISHLAQRLRDRHINVEFTNNAKKQLIDEGYDVAFGARPLKRTIQQRLENKLAAELLEGKFAEGDTIKIDANAHTFTFKKVE